MEEFSDINEINRGLDCLSISYSRLVKKFGNPNGEFDHCKSDVCWEGKINGKDFYIMNWKDGKNYCGKAGLNVEDITYWNIGGCDEEVVESLENYINSDGLSGLWEIYMRYYE